MPGFDADLDAAKRHHDRFMTLLEARPELRPPWWHRVFGSSKVE